ncbi:hypothetical protein JR316_0011207 [Psilocybe cubensis]|uniref:Uncharacterized protein n=1 Tax=Psilocybe cubensis TaxID=181762 RepID=A0ACB8GJL2_PSICU|nr:hypothetical protein JR316_0011207 [Psilocybe cubensis]KAH9475650.1 hypothetical protein JR316_0011207 [Psilocybe cubensis]
MGPLGWLLDLIFAIAKGRPWEWSLVTYQGMNRGLPPSRQGRRKTVGSLMGPRDNALDLGRAKDGTHGQLEVMYQPFLYVHARLRLDDVSQTDTLNV